jgi:hypothetical protein
MVRLRHERSICLRAGTEVGQRLDSVGKPAGTGREQLAAGFRWLKVSRHRGRRVQQVYVSSGNWLI